MSAHAPYAVDVAFSAIMRGADITVAAQSASAYNVPGLPSGQDSAGFGARVDGLGLMTGRGDGAGGVQLQANINNMQITNNILENNSGIFAGGLHAGAQPVLAQRPSRQRRGLWGERGRGERLHRDVWLSASGLPANVGTLAVSPSVVGGAGSAAGRDDAGDRTARRPTSSPA